MALPERVIKVAGLTKRQVRIWHLYADKRLTHKDIAEKLGTSRSSITRTLKKILEKIDKNFPEKDTSVFLNSVEKGSFIATAAQADIWDGEGKMRHGFSTVNTLQHLGDKEGLFEVDFTDEGEREIHCFVHDKLEKSGIKEKYQSELYGRFWMAVLEAQRKGKDKEQGIEKTLRDWHYETFHRY